MRKIKTFKFNHYQAQDLDYVDGFINDWLDSNNGILIQSSSTYASNGHLLTRVVYEVKPKEISLSDYLGNNSGIFTVIGVFVALTIFSFSLSQTKSAAYVGAACIGFILLILIDLYFFRSPKGERTKTLSFFFIYFELLILNLFIFWIVRYRVELRMLDEIWAICIFSIIFDFISKKFPKVSDYFRDKDDGYFLRRLVLLAAILLIGIIPIIFMVSRSLDWLTYLMTKK